MQGFAILLVALLMLTTISVTTGFAGPPFLTDDFGERLTLGSEIFSQGKSSDDNRSFAVFNLGGLFKITPNFQILFSGGHTLAGGNHTLGYLGLYWTG